MDDEDFIELLLQYGITPNRLLQILLFSVLAAMICVNVWLFKKVRKNWNSPSGNETIMDWCQNMNEIEVDFPLPKVEEDGKRPTSRDVECKITSNNIRFAFKGEKAPMLEGTLTKSVLPDECNWQFWPVGNPTHIKLSLIKESAGNWKTVLSNDATGSLLDDSKKKKKKKQ